MATLHEAGRIVVQASVRLRGGGASRTYRFRRVRRKLPLHVLRRVRLKLARRQLRTVKRALRRGKRLRATVTARADYTSGNRDRTTRRIRLRP
jgi:hypothetical protein